MNPHTSPVRRARYSGDGNPPLIVLITSLAMTEVSITTMKISPGRVGPDGWYSCGHEEVPTR
jgi:hypothetical protein